MDIHTHVFDSEYQNSSTKSGPAFGPTWTIFLTFIYKCLIMPDFPYLLVSLSFVHAKINYTKLSICGNLTISGVMCNELISQSIPSPFKNNIL